MINIIQMSDLGRQEDRDGRARDAQDRMALASQLAAGPTLAYARMKENLNRSWHTELGAMLDQEALNMRLSATTQDHREAARAFVEKRQPAFKGE